jgi:hypothetical protein
MNSAAMRRLQGELMRGLFTFSVEATITGVASSSRRTAATSRSPAARDWPKQAAGSSSVRWASGTSQEAL